MLWENVFSCSVAHRCVRKRATTRKEKPETISFSPYHTAPAYALVGNSILSIFVISFSSYAVLRSILHRRSFVCVFAWENKTRYIVDILQLWHRCTSFCWAYNASHETRKDVSVSVMLRPTTVTDLVYDIFSCYFRSGSTNKVNGLLFSFLTLFISFLRNKIRSGGVVSIKVRLSRNQGDFKISTDFSAQTNHFLILQFFLLSSHFHFFMRWDELVGNCSCLCAIFFTLSRSIIIHCTIPLRSLLGLCESRHC